MERQAAAALAAARTAQAAGLPAVPVERKVVAKEAAVKATQVHWDAVMVATRAEAQRVVAMAVAMAAAAKMVAEQRAADSTAAALAEYWCLRRTRSTRR